jgi:hypothetical protein
LPKIHPRPYYSSLIFLSYSRQNASAAADLLAALEQRGHEVWRDTDDIPSGSAWREMISQAIATAQAVVVLLSAQATDSESVARELSLADEMGKLILPVLVGVCDIRVGRLAYTLSGVQLIDGLSQSMSDVVADIESALPASGTQHTSTAQLAPPSPPSPPTAPPPPPRTPSPVALPVEVTAAPGRRYGLALLAVAAVVVAGGTVGALAMRGGNEGATTTLTEAPIVTTAATPQVTTTVIPEPTTVIPEPTTAAPTTDPQAATTVIPEPTTAAPTTDPHGAAIASRCVRANIDFAAVREAPGIKQLEVGRIPPSTCDVQVYAIGTDGRIAWLQVGVGDIFGWSAESNFT